MRIRVHIDSLVLHGVAAGPHQAPAVRRAIEQELGRRLELQHDFEPLQAASLAAEAEPLTGSTPREIGTAAAAAIHGSLPAHAE